MPTIIVVVLILFIGALSILFGVNHLKKSAGSKQASAVTYAAGSVKNGGMTKKQIKARLKHLAESKPPKDLAPGAMCYEMVAPPNRVEYICPVCSAKTLHAVPEDRKNPYSGPEFKAINALRWDLPACRRIRDSLKQHSVEIVENEFCKKCSPQVKAPRLGLKVSYSDASAPHVVMGVNRDDCVLLNEFFKGSNKFKHLTDNEEPLKHKIPRLKELLGVQQGVK
jgi:hypothetical protein